MSAPPASGTAGTTPSNESDHTPTERGDDYERTITVGNVSVEYPSPIYEDPPDPKRPEAYAPGTGEDRFTRLIWDYMSVRLTPEQRLVIRSVEKNKRTLAYGANGFGKTFLAAALTNAWQNCHYEAITFATSGTYKKMRRTFCKDVEQLHDSAINGRGFDGRYKQSNPRIEIDGEPNHFFEADKPADAGELEGVHADYLLAIVEEADKDAVTDDILGSMSSLITDDRDRMLAIANPPEDESNSVHRLIEDDQWTKLRFSSFDAHNVKLEMGERPGPEAGGRYLGPVSGLATISKIRDDWISYTNEPWPGAEDARTAHLDRDDMPSGWLRRRIGIMPGETANVNRPFRSTTVNSAFSFDHSLPDPTEVPILGIALDVARKGGDKNVLAVRTPRHIGILDAWSGMDHVENEAHVRDLVERNIDSNPYAKAIQRDGPLFAVDATPEGSGLADNIGQWYSRMYRFNNGAKAIALDEYRDKWAEGLGLLGAFFQSGGTISNQRLREELLAAARTVEFSEKYYESRDAEVYKASKKDKISDSLGRSPDHLDSALMANLVAERREDIAGSGSDFYDIISA